GDGGPDLRVDGHPAPGVEVQTDAQPPRVEPSTRSAFRMMARIVDGEARKSGVVPIIGSGDDVHAGFDIGPPARERRGPATERGGVERDPTEAGFESGQAEPWARQADRTADIGTDMDGAVPGGGRRSGSGARTAGGEFGVQRRTGHSVKGGDS